MKYFFVLGNNKTLSVSEIISVFSEANTGDLLGGGVFVFEVKNEIDAQSLIKKIGGTIKIGLIVKEIHELKQGSIINEVKKIANINNFEGKFKYGISNYGKTKVNTKQLAMELKKHLRENNVSCRWVTSKENTLSSVVVEQNSLTDKGLEIVLLKHQNKVLVGKTLAVQPFKDLSKRDYGRPARDDESGMLPPKLAQIMINLSQCSNDSVLLDPFCGSGTILTEAMLMGYKKLVGTDVSKKAITDTKKNIGWISQNIECDTPNIQLNVISATDLSKHIKLSSVDAIVTEPFLGPQRGYLDLNKIKKELEKLYSDAIKEFKKVLKPDGKIVMLWPVFKIGKNGQNISPSINGLKIINSISSELLNKQNIELTKRNTIIYGREGQRVWREVVVLKKI